MLAERPTRLSTGGFSKMMLYSSLLLGETSRVYCDVGRGRACICREGVSGCTANIRVGLFTCTMCPSLGEAPQECTGAARIPV